MRQFDVCKNPNPDTASYAPYLLILQSDLLEPVATCVVAPLLKPDTFKPLTKLNPMVTVDGKDYILSTAELAGIPRRAIGQVIGSLDHKRSDIIAALDLLFLGF